MKIARIQIAVALALLAAAPVPAAVAPPKPPADAPASTVPAPDEAKPADTPAPAPAPPPGEAPRRSGTDLGARFAAWLGDSGVPIWAWALLAVAAFLLLRGLFRGNDRRDLIGPPSSLRLGARPVAPRPRRPDPPRRL